MWEGLSWYGFFVSCFCSFLVGSLAVVWYVSSQQARRILASAPLRPVRPDIQLIKHKVAPSTNHPITSGSPHVDNEIQKIVELCLRDYVQSWYHTLICGSTNLLEESKSTAGLVVSNISKRCQEPDLLPLFMEALVSVLIDHFKLYKAALGLVVPDKDVERCIFELDNEGWSIICQCEEAELEYVRYVTSYVLKLTLPEEDFNNPLFRSLAQDLLVENVLLPTAHYVTTPLYLNSTVISLTKDNSLNGESLFISLSDSTSNEVSIALSMTVDEINYLKKKGKSEMDQMQLNSLVELRDQLSQMQETGLRKADEVKYKGQFPTLSVTVSEYRVTEGRARHAEYKIIVQCQHRQGPQEEWITWRRFSDLYDLHLKLKEQVPHSDLPSLPSQTKAFNKLEQAFLVHKQHGMQGYLTAISSQDFLDNHPQLFGEIILFLTEQSYVRQTTEIARTVDKLVQPWKTSSKPKAEPFRTNSPSTYRKIPMEGEEEEDLEEEDGLAILMTLLDEVFDISSNDQWLQRQLTNLLRQLLGSMLSDKMGQRMMEALDNYATGERIANLISQLRNSIWPHGYPAEPREPPTQEFLHLTSLLSRTKLIGSVPDDLKRLLGTNTTNQGIIRLFNMFQIKSLNIQLLYRLVEALLCALYPERDLSYGFNHVRSQIKLKYNV